MKTENPVSAAQTVAVIDIGASAIRMVVAEVGQKGDIRYLENLQRPVNFGKDVFTTGRIGNPALRDALLILKDYKAALETYRVQKVHAVATSALREASNRDNVIDRIFVRTGIDVEPIDGAEENRLELVAVERALGESIDLTQRNCLIMEVGSGSTEMIVLDHGQVKFNRNLSFGTMRLPERISGSNDPALAKRLLKKHVKDVCGQLAAEYPLEKIDTFITLGADMRFAAQKLQADTAAKFTVLEKKDVETFIKEIGKKTPEEMVSEFSLAYSQAETLSLALLVYLYFLAEIPAQNIIVPMLSIRDGLLLELSQLFSVYKRTDLSKQVINSCRHLGEKYHYDKAHAASVAALALKLFDTLQAEHGMGARDRLFLEAAAYLHEVGAYISPSSYHKHSTYIVRAAEIFGLRRSHKEIVANVVRYHRKGTPRQTDSDFMSLPRAERATVSKLTAFLIVAKALDESRQQKIKNLQVEVTDSACTIWVSNEAGDITMERDALQQKANIFADIFGVPIELKQKEKLS